MTSKLAHEYPFPSFKQQNERRSFTIPCFALVFEGQNKHVLSLHLVKQGIAGTTEGNQQFPVLRLQIIGGPPGMGELLQNIRGRLKGMHPHKPGQRVVRPAHYI